MISSSSITSSLYSNEKVRDFGVVCQISFHVSSHLEKPWFEVRFSTTYIDASMTHFSFTQRLWALALQQYRAVSVGKTRKIIKCLEVSPTMGFIITAFKNVVYSGK